jgi:antirestriction protein ArdC
MILSTGHSSRLNRKAYQKNAVKEIAPFTPEALIAEIGASYLCSYCDIDPWNFENRLEYAQGWIERFKEDRNCLVYAALQALHAVDYILGVKHWNTAEQKASIEPIQIEEDADE